MIIVNTFFFCNGLRSVQYWGTILFKVEIGGVIYFGQSMIVKGGYLKYL